MWELGKRLKRKKRTEKDKRIVKDEGDGRII